MGRYFLGAFIRFLVGVLVWLLLAALVILSAMPYGGGDRTFAVSWGLATWFFPFWVFVPWGRLLFGPKASPDSEEGIAEQIAKPEEHLQGGDQKILCPNCFSTMSAEPDAEDPNLMRKRCFCAKCNSVFKLVK